MPEEKSNSQYAEMILFGSDSGRRDTDMRRGTMQRSALKMLNSSLPETAESYELLTMLGFSRPTICDSVMLAMVYRAQRGDVDAARFLRDSSGQKETMSLHAPVEDHIDRLNLSSLSDDELYALVEATEAEEAGE